MQESKAAVCSPPAAISPIIHLDWRCLHRHYQFLCKAFVLQIKFLCVVMAQALDSKQGEDTLDEHMGNFENFYENNTELHVDGVRVLLVLRFFFRRPELLELFVADCIFDKLRNVCTCLQQESNINSSWTAVVPTKPMKLPTYTVFTTKELQCKQLWWPETSSVLLGSN